MRTTSLYALAAILVVTPLAQADAALGSAGDPLADPAATTASASTTSDHCADDRTCAYAGIQVPGNVEVG